MEKEIVKTKQLRKDIDEILQRVKELSNTRERNLSITKLQEGIMWLGMHLKALNSPDPYPESKNPDTGAYVAPTADGLKL